MSRMAFDFDNTMFSCINSDYYLYRKSLEVLGFAPLSFEVYKEYRYQFPISEILSRSNISEFETFFRARRGFANEEEHYLKDTPIVDRSLLQKIACDHELILISKRNSEYILRRQLKDWNLEMFTFILVTGKIQEDELVDSKAKLITDSKSELYVGDRNTDILSAQKARVESVFVQTGFQKIQPNVKTFKTVNHFIEEIIGR